MEAGGVARLGLRPPRAPAFAARRRADALPGVALFLLLVGALRRFDSPWAPPSAKKAAPPQIGRRLLPTLGGGGGGGTTVRRFFPQGHCGRRLALRPPGRRLQAIP